MAATCVMREFIIHDASVNEVEKACHKALKEMGLKILKEEETGGGSVAVLAAEGALVPVIVKAFLAPLGLDDYVRAAQRSGLHIGISPGEDGIHLYFCGIALEEVTGKLKQYTQEDIWEEVTDMLEEENFEDKFIKRILSAFPKTEEIK
jgi:hypothetical protein